MLSRSEASLCPARQTLRGVYPERSEWAQGDSMRQLRLMHAGPPDPVPSALPKGRLLLQLVDPSAMLWWDFSTCEHENEASSDEREKSGST